MGFLSKLFGGKNKEQTDTVKEEQTANDNIRLIRLLDKWGREESEHSFRAVIHELFEGSSYLLLPSLNDEGEITGQWVTLTEGAQIKLTSLFQEDGLKVLAAFSDEDALSRWAEKETAYTAIPSQAVFDMCREMGVDRVVINSGQKNMFVLERQKESEISEEETLEEGSHIRIGVPATPLDSATVGSIRQNLVTLPTVRQAYQYLQENAHENGDPEVILMIGVCLSEDNDENRQAAVRAVKQGLQGQKKPSYPVGIMILDEKWIEGLQGLGIQPFHS